MSSAIPVSPFLGINTSLPPTQLEKFERGERVGSFMRALDNVDVTDTGTLRTREGWKQKLGGLAVRGLYGLADGTALVADHAKLCRLSFDGSVLSKAELTDKLHPLAYELIDLRIRPAIGGRSRPLALVSREWLNAEVCDWRDSQLPASWAIQDERSIRIVGKITEGDVLHLECYRLPRWPLCNDSDEPEIHEAHHEHLIQYALMQAYSVPDSEVFDPARARMAEELFTTYFGRPVDSDLRRITRHDVVHHNVAVLP